MREYEVLSRIIAYDGSQIHPGTTLLISSIEDGWVSASDKGGMSYYIRTPDFLLATKEWWAPLKEQESNI